MVNEMRVGYNLDTSKRQSTFHADDVSAQLGLDPAPSLGADRLGFPSIKFQSGPNRPTNIADAARNVDRTVDQNAFSISDNFTWIRGAHSLKAGGLWNRNMARDGFGFGVNFRGRYRFNARATGNAFTDFLLGLPSDVARSGDQPRSARRPLRTTIAFFAQDDWKLSPKRRRSSSACATRSSGAWHEKDDTLANFIPTPTAATTSCRTPDVAAKLPPGADREGPHAHRVGQAGVPDTLINADKNNFSPRVGLRLASRREQQDRAARRLRALPSDRRRAGHPRSAGHERVPLRATRFRGGGLSNGFSGGTPSTDAADFGNEGIDPNLQSPDIYQYNITVEREMPGNIGLRVSYIGSTMRKLLVDRDFNTLQASTVPFDPSSPDGLRAAAVPALQLLHGHRRQPRRGPVQRAAVRSCRGGTGTGSR